MICEEGHEWENEFTVRSVCAACVYVTGLIFVRTHLGKTPREQPHLSQCSTNSLYCSIPDPLKELTARCVRVRACITEEEGVSELVSNKSRDISAAKHV